MVLTVVLVSFFPTKSHASTASPAAGSNPHAELIHAKTKSRLNPALPVRVYGNSVIPGGVHGSSELVAALERDEILRTHFIDFDTANARVVHLKRARLVHVSYRMGNNSYWTKNRVRLAKGETLLTDGKSFVRTRCGNRIADIPQLMVSRMEPAPEVLETALDMPREALNLTSYSPGTGQAAGIANGSSDTSRNFTAPVDTLGMQASGPLADKAFGDQRTLPAVAELPAAVLDQVKKLFPALPEAINNEVLSGPVVAPLTELTPSDSTIPLMDNVTVPVSLSALTTLPLPHGDLNTVAVQTEDSAVPEPGVAALLGLSLVSLGLCRRRRAPTQAASS